MLFRSSLPIASRAAAAPDGEACPLDKNGIALSRAEFLIHEPDIPWLMSRLIGAIGTPETPADGVEYWLRCQYSGPADRIDIRLRYGHAICDYVRRPPRMLWNIECR